MAENGAPRVARLAAAAETLLAASNGAMEKAVRQQHERTIAAAQGAEAFQTVWAEGEKLLLEEAVAVALEA